MDSTRLPSPARILVLPLHTIRRRLIRPCDTLSCVVARNILVALCKEPVRIAEPADAFTPPQLLVTLYEQPAGGHRLCTTCIIPVAMPKLRRRTCSRQGGGAVAMSLQMVLLTATAVYSSRLAGDFLLSGCVSGAAAARSWGGAADARLPHHPPHSTFHAPPSFFQLIPVPASARSLISPRGWSP